MQRRKAENMLNYLKYLKDNSIPLNIIESNNVCKPIKDLEKLVKKGIDANE